MCHKKKVVNWRHYEKTGTILLYLWWLDYPESVSEAPNCCYEISYFGNHGMIISYHALMLLSSLVFSSQSSALFTQWNRFVNETNHSLGLYSFAFVRGVTYNKKNPANQRLHPGQRLHYPAPSCVCLFKTWLQLIQNSAARLVFCARKHDHVTPLLVNLHWLPIQCRIQFKIRMMTFKVLRGEAPSHLYDLITPYVPTRTLRSQNKLYSYTSLVSILRVTDGVPPCLWNDLLYNIKNSKDRNNFKKLKTHLFKKAFAL